MASIFTKIIKGELPCFKLHEDEFTFSFLTLHQVSPGHSLVIPKVEVDRFTDVDDPHYLAVFKHAKLLSKALEQATGCKRVGTAIVGFEVPHFHYHLIPMNSMDDFSFAKAKERSLDENKRMQKLIVEKLAALV